MDQLLTLQQIAAYLRVSPKTVRRFLKRGLPHVRLGGCVRFVPGDVARWVEGRKEG